MANASASRTTSLTTGSDKLTATAGFDTLRTSSAAGQRKRILKLLRHAEGMLDNFKAQLDEANAAVRDEDEGNLSCALEQLTFVMLELSVDTRNILYEAKGY